MTCGEQKGEIGNMKWIRASEKLPDRHVYVLTYNAVRARFYGHAFAIGIHMRRVDWEGQDLWIGYPDHVTVTSDKITHWQPLPIAPDCED
jgi:hypothetical protein